MEGFPDLPGCKEKHRACMLDGLCSRVLEDVHVLYFTSFFYYIEYGLDVHGIICYLGRLFS